MSTKTLYTCVWNGYWEKFGQKWINEVNNLNTQPDEVLVISDKQINCPYQVILANPRLVPHPINLFRQIALDNCHSDWYCPSDIDDIMFPNYLDDLKDDYDVHAVWMTSNNDNKYHLPNWKLNSKRIWENMINIDTSLPFPGRSFIKTKLAKTIGYTKYGYEDYIFWLRLSLLNSKPKVYFNNVERFNYTHRPPNGLTITDIKQKEKECEQIRKLLKDNKNFKPEGVI